MNIEKIFLELNNRFLKQPCCVVLCFIIFLALVLFCFWLLSFLHLSISIPTTITLIGTFFAFLKYKIDRANHHASLFDKRFAIFSIINSVVWEWASAPRENKSRVSEEMIRKISDDLMWKSYYLFSKSTFEFIKNIRKNLIDFQAYQDKDINKLNDEDKQKYNKANAFLAFLVDGENLAENFYALKKCTNFYD